MSDEALSAAPQFAILRDERISKDGKAAIDLAEMTWNKGGSRATDQAAKFLLLAVRLDATESDKRLARLEKRLQDEDKRRSSLANVGKLRVVDGAAS